VGVGVEVGISDGVGLLVGVTVGSGPLPPLGVEVGVDVASRVGAAEASGRGDERVAAGVT
jgi:hypothetical protein